MLRSSNPAGAMQKTYDDCYLICSTAVYFEKHNNEQEALRSWRNALDNIYYNNAYKIPATWRPKTETEKALQESLRAMEMQCKERVDLLETLQKSRLDSGVPSRPASAASPRSSFPDRTVSSTSVNSTNGTIGQGTIPAAEYSSLPARPKLPQRLTVESRSNLELTRSNGDPQTPPEDGRRTSQTLPVPALNRSSRTPSPDKKPSMLKTTLRNAKDSKSSSRLVAKSLRDKPVAAATAATMAWPGASNGNSAPPAVNSRQTRPLSPPEPRLLSKTSSRDNETAQSSRSSASYPSPVSPARAAGQPNGTANKSTTSDYRLGHPGSPPKSSTPLPSPPPPTNSRLGSASTVPKIAPSPSFPSYRREYVAPTAMNDQQAQSLAATLHGNTSSGGLPAARVRQKPAPSRGPAPPVPRKAVGAGSRALPASAKGKQGEWNQSSESEVDMAVKRKKSRAAGEDEMTADGIEQDEESEWEARVNYLMKNLPRGVDEQAAKSIFNEIVIKGDEVHWDDVAGLDVAKTALKEAVVYPFLRPDLFMGLREPARGMLLFGPPGTGKTMLARAVATESKSTFFAISASSLTSKFLGESEKLVRALFAIAKALAPSIIFVDEIDSLLSARSGSGEHEATRRIKTEFLIQWSDLAKAAAGRETDKSKTEGDATRVLVLAATNLPWAIDEAARRRFVRRQYIPLPEPPVRESQLRRLMSAQKHCLSNHDFNRLVRLTDGFSGSDITALAKDAAMGPLRSLGENLLRMSPEDIQPIGYRDFEKSLVTIRPSVSKQGLKDYEDWARDFGERGG